MKTKLITLFSAFLLTASSYGALTYNFSTLIAGTTTPLGPAPWLTFSVTEINSTAVQLTVNSNVNSKEFWSSIAINLNSSYDFNTPRTFSNYTQVGLFDAPSVTSGNNIFIGGAGGRYDVLFAMATSGNDNGAHRFDDHDSFSFRIDGIGIAAFQTEDVNSAIAHVQQLEGGESAWLGAGPVASQVPEASSALLGAIGSLALLRRRR